jgi:hypothetical protein
MEFTNTDRPSSTVYNIHPLLDAGVQPRRESQRDSDLSNSIDLENSIELKKEMTRDAEKNLFKEVRKEKSRIEKDLEIGKARLSRPGKTALFEVVVSAKHKLPISRKNVDASAHAVHYNIFKLQALLIDLVRLVFARLLKTLIVSDEMDSLLPSLKPIYEALTRPSGGHAEVMEICQTLLEMEAVGSRPSIALMLELCLAEFKTVENREWRSPKSDASHGNERYRNVRTTNLVDPIENEPVMPFRRDHRDYYSSVDTVEEEKRKDMMLARNDAPIFKEIHGATQREIDELGLRDGVLERHGKQYMYQFWNLANSPNRKALLSRVSSRYDAQIEKAIEYLLQKLGGILNDEVRGTVAEVMCNHHRDYSAHEPRMLRQFSDDVLPQTEVLIPGDSRVLNKLTPERALEVCHKLVETDAIKFYPYILIRLKSCIWQYLSVDMFRQAQNEAIVPMLRNMLTFNGPPIREAVDCHTITFDSDDESSEMETDTETESESESETEEQTPIRRVQFQSFA